MVNNKQLTLIAPTMHCTLPSCIAPCSVYLFGLAVAEHVLEFGRYDYEDPGKSLRAKPLDCQGNCRIDTVKPKGYSVVKKTT